MKDKLNITIRIANQPPIPLTIKPEEEEIIRQAEDNVNRLWNRWSERFNTGSEALLAMVAFQFAKLHAALSAEMKTSVDTLRELERELNEMLPESEPGGSEGKSGNVAPGSLFD